MTAIDPLWLQIQDQRDRAHALVVALRALETEMRLEVQKARGQGEHAEIRAATTRWWADQIAALLRKHGE